MFQVTDRFRFFSRFSVCPHAIQPEQNHTEHDQTEHDQADRAFLSIILLNYSSQLFLSKRIDRVKIKLDLCFPEQIPSCCRTGPGFSLPGHLFRLMKSTGTAGAVF